jgi:hypothetical protein
MQEEKTKPRDELFESLVAVCGINPAIYGRPRLNRELKTFRDGGVTPELFVQFGNWFRRYDWRGQKGELPTPAVIRECWAQFEEWKRSQGLQEHRTPPPDPSPAPEAPPPVVVSAELKEWAWSQHIDAHREKWWGELAETDRQARERREKDRLSFGESREFWDRNPRALPAAALEAAQRRYAEERCPLETFDVDAGTWCF